MKDWEDIIKERQLSRKAELPESDWNDFLSRREAHERAAKKRHMILTATLSIPTAAAVLLLLLLVPFNTDVPDNQVSQNEPSEQPVIADSVDNHPVDSVMVPAKPEPVKTVIKESKPVKKIFAQDKKPEPQPEIADTLGELQINQLLAEVPVSAVVAKVQMPNDTAIFNSAAYKIPEGTSIEDVIRKLPGVEIADDGSITVNGKQVNRILFNGKEFFNTDSTKSLTQLTAEMIEKVKAYEKNSDLSRQTGIDDGRDEPVLVFDNVGSISGIASTFKIPLIVFDGEVMDVPENKLASFDFSKSYNDRDSLSSLLGVKRGKIIVLKALIGPEAIQEWGVAGQNGVLEVMSGKYYRKSKRAGKLDGGPYEIVPRTKH